MLNIVVLGSGLIPRGYGIAPRKNPFPADLKLIKLMIDTNGLKPCFINPDTKALVPLTAANCEKMYQIYGTEKKSKAVVAEKSVKTVTVINTASSTSTSAVNTVSSQPTTPVKSEETKVETTKVEGKKDDHIVINVNNNSKDEKKK